MALDGLNCFKQKKSCQKLLHITGRHLLPIE